MKKLLFTFFLINLTACSGLTEWTNGWTEYATSSLASTVSQTNFTKQEQEDLYHLLKEIIYSRSCSQVQTYISANDTLYTLELDHNLSKDFLFDGLLNFNFNSAVVSLVSSSKLEKTTLAIVTSWKQDYALSDVNLGIQQVKKCYPKEFY